MLMLRSGRADPGWLREGRRSRTSHGGEDERHGQTQDRRRLKHHRLPKVAEVVVNGHAGRIMKNVPVNVDRDVQTGRRVALAGIASSIFLATLNIVVGI